MCLYSFLFRLLNQTGLESNESDSVGKSSVPTHKVKKQRAKDTVVAAEKSDLLGFEPDEILGATEIDGKITFRIKVKGSDSWEFVKAKRAHKACPKLVIEFYEKHLILDGTPLIRNWYWRNFKKKKNRNNDNGPSEITVRNWYFVFSIWFKVSVN